jgi:hypothetical protein
MVPCSPGVQNLSYLGPFSGFWVNFGLFFMLFQVVETPLPTLEIPEFFYS